MATTTRGVYQPCPPPVRSALGIRVGDCVRTREMVRYPEGDYVAGISAVQYRVVGIHYSEAGEWWPYVVRLNGWEDRWRCDEPSVTLIVKQMPWPDSRKNNRGDASISNIVLRDGRWFAVRWGQDGDWLVPVPDREIIVERDDSFVVVEQLEMFA